MFSIPIDLLSFESVQIDFLIKITGPNYIALKIQPNNGLTLNQLWGEYNGTVIAGNGAIQAALDKANYDGQILVNTETQGLTNSITCKIFKVWDVGTHSQRYLFTATGLFCIAGLGMAKTEINAMVDSFRPTGLYISVPSGNLMTFSYSVIKDSLITS